MDKKTLAQIVIDTDVIFDPIYAEIERVYQYLASRHYTEEELQRLDELKRPSRSYNLALSQFKLLVGDFIDNNTPVEVKPYSADANRELADVWNDLIEYVEQQNDYEYIVTRFALAGFARVGYLLPMFTNEKQSNGSILIKNIDEVDVAYDPEAKDPLLDDAQFWYRSIWMSKEQLKVSVPKKHRKEIDERMKLRLDGTLAQDVGEYVENRKFSDIKNGLYRIIEFHYFEYKDQEYEFDPRTANAPVVFNMEGEEREKYLKKNPQIRIITKESKKIKRTIEYIPAIDLEVSNADDILQDGTHDIVHLSAYSAFTQKQVDSFGEARSMLNVQDGFNEFINIAEQTQRKISNPPTAVKPEYIENWNAVHDNFDSPGTTIHLTSDAPDIDRVIQKYNPSNMPFSSIEYATALMDMMPKITGINNNMMGLQETKEENASLFAQRVEQGRLGLQSFFNAYQRAATRLYQKIISLAKINMTGPRLLRLNDVTNNDIRKVWINYEIGGQVINDITKGQYKVYVQAGKDDKNARFMRYMKKLELTRMLVEILGPQAIVPEWVFVDSDIPGIEKLQERVNMILGIQEQQQQQEEAMNTVAFIQDQANQQVATQEEAQRRASA
jgi:hypothetical protein